MRMLREKYQIVKNMNGRNKKQDVENGIFIELLKKKSQVCESVRAFDRQSRANLFFYFNNVNKNAF